MTSTRASRATITRLDNGAAFDLFAVDAMGRIIAADTFRTEAAAERAVERLGIESFTYLHNPS